MVHFLADRGVNRADLMKFANEHPLIIKLDLSRFLFLVDDIISFLDQMNALNQFTCRLTSSAERDRLMNELDTDWQFETFTDDDTKIIMNR